MPVTPLTTVKKPEFTLPYMKAEPGILQNAAPNAPATPPPTPGILTAPPTPAPPAPYTTNPATAKESTAVGYTPEGFTVDPNQTVEGRLAGIEAKDSQLMQQADARARMKMQARGLLSSSAAVGAGQAAVIDAALPIAQQDANTYAQAHTNTQNAKNAALNFGAGAQNDASNLNAQLGTNVSLANAEAANKALQDSFNAQANYGLATLDANVKIALSNLDTQTKIALTQMENENRQQLQANQDAASMFNQVATAIANISTNPNLSKAAKDAAIASQLSLLNEGLRQQGAVAGLDLGSYFNQAQTATAGDPVNFSDLPLNASIPNGGRRDAQGNVYNADGSLANWRGPVGMPVTIGADGQEVPTPSTPGSGGTTTNPSIADQVKNWKPGMPVPPGYRQDNRGGRIVKI